MLERQVIQSFAEALEEENEPALRRVASTRFEEKAMRSDDVLRDLELLELPEGKISVDDVEELDEGRRRVVVTDAAGKKYRFELLRDPKKKRWVVDDILVRQKKKWKRVNAVVTRSTTQVMDLIFTIREFLDVWADGSRDRIVAMTSPGLTLSLKDVPDPWLKSITSGIAGRYEAGMARQPEIQMNDDDAVVKLPVRGGHLLVSVTQKGHQWLVDDIEIHRRSKSGPSGSVRRQADAVAGLARFLRACEEDNLEALKATATSEFYSETLQFADLSLVQLPSPNSVPEQFDIRVFSGRVIIMVPAAGEIIRFDLVESVSGPTAQQRHSAAGRSFQVSSVILYDRNRQNQRTLAAVFTAPARATLFVKSLENRDVALLKQLSSRSLRESVWNDVAPETLSKLTIPISEFRNMTLSDSNVQGRRTELTFRTAANGQVQYAMVEENGSLKVDDVQYPDSTGQTLSLKTQLALQIPVSEFAQAWKAQNQKQLRKVSSTEFNRLALSHFPTTPPDPGRLADRLDTPVLSTRVTQERATLSVGLTLKSAIQVKLVAERGRWVVDDVHIPGSGGGTVQLRQSLRHMVVDSMLNSSESQRQTLHTARAPHILQPVGSDAAPLRSGVDPIGGSGKNPHGWVVGASWEVPDSIQGRNTPGPDSVQFHDASDGSLPGLVESGSATPARTAGDAATGTRLVSGNEPWDDGRFLHFGPGVGKTSSSASAADAAARPDLADRPIPID